MPRHAAVYILTNGPHGTLYTGVTGDLLLRITRHRDGCGSKFTSRYNLTRLVWFEFGQDIEAAIELEKRIKAGSRARKISLIEAMNPAWEDLYEKITG